MNRHCRPAAVAVAAAIALACGHSPPLARPQPSAAEDAARHLRDAEKAAGTGPGAAVRAGWLRYLIASDAPDAEQRLRGALSGASGATRALALCGIAEILEDRLDTKAAVQAWIDAVRAAPQDPMAELAALRLLDAQGDSLSVDDAIIAAAEEATAPMAPRAARLLREAAARAVSSRVADAGPQAEARAWARMGAVQRWRVAGPFGALRVFDLSRRLALDGPESVVAPAKGPAGPTGSRALDFPDGDVGLDLEPSDGDVFYAASELRIERGGAYLAWIEGAAALELRLDGNVAIARSPYPREVPRAQTAAVTLEQGTHQALVRWSRAEGARFRLTLVRADGGPTDISSAAPAELRGSRLSAPCPLGGGCTARPAWDQPVSLRDVAERQLEQDGGDALAAWLLARAVIGDERAIARTAVDRAVAASGSGAPALLLRAQEVLRDPEIPDRLGRSRALVDVAQSTRKDPLLLRGRLIAAALQRDAERYEAAEQELQQAEAALRHVNDSRTKLASATPAVATSPARVALPPRLSVARARLVSAQGNPSAARDVVAGALRADPGRCDSRTLDYELARRDGSVTDQRRTAEGLLRCGDGAATFAAMLRDRGELARAEQLLAVLAAAHPAQPARLHSLADLQAARDEVDAAARSLTSAAALAPRSADSLRRLAGLLEASGDAKRAEELRARALSLAPGDLALRRQLALSRGEDVLQWADRDGLAIARDGAVKAPPGASAVRLLDHGAVEIYADTGAVERVHSIIRVLDKKGVSRFGEAQIPGGSEVLHLRTIKRDGRTLEPESIPEKEGVTLPGLEPGDAVEVDYLHALPPRGPELPGIAPGGFFFRDERTPMVESTYEVRAPPQPALEIDAHNVKPPPVERDANGQRFSMSVRNIAPQEPEPLAPPEAETMPWVQIGTGAAQRDLLLSIADWALLRARPGGATDELARAAGGGSPRDKARRIYSKVAQAVRGRSQGADFSSPAAHVLAQARGNRLLPLKAALASAEIASHIVLVRAFNQDQGQYRFPRMDAYPWAVLRIDLPDGAAWIDPTYRLAPFGELPAFLRDQDAWVVPEPFEEPTRIRTPAASGEEGREIEMRFALDSSGAAEGTGRDKHMGFEAAGLKDALERLDDTQRKQAVESMLSRGLRGVELDSLTVEGEADVGGPATALYGMRVQLARKDGPQLFVPSSLLPQRLGRRFVQRADRALPLLVESTEKQTTRSEIVLPDGFHLRSPPPPVSIQTPFGAFSWSVREQRGRMVVEEAFSMPRQRVPAAQYARFAEFARRIDDVEGQDLIVAGPDSAR